MANPDPTDPDPEPEPEPEPAWKVRIRAMVEDAETRLDSIRWALDGVPLHLEPMTVDDPACARNRITHARATLMVATEDLFFCAALIHAVEILALHAVETHALDLAGQETGLQRALDKLVGAREHAVKAQSAVHGCNGYLVTAFVLLDAGPAVPGVDPSVEHKREQTIATLATARSEVQECATLVGLAGQDLAADH